MAIETGQKVARSILLIGATGTIRTAMFREKEHLVVPTVALIEGVIWPVNAEHPELVLFEEFSFAPQAWNGRPVVYGHPFMKGEAVSANDPRILEGWAFGTVFNASLNSERKALQMEAWIDPLRAAAIGAQELVTRLNEGKTIEISVGVFTREQEKSGEFNGKHYDGIWRDPVPDHLALLPDGYIGACSNDMGCGAPRVAVAHLVTNKGFVTFSRTEEPKVAATKTEDAKPPKKTNMAARALRSISKEENVRFLRTAEGESSSELAGMLWEAIYAAEPGFMWLEDFWPDQNLVAYLVRPEDREVMYQRKYTVDNGKVTLDAEKTEVEWVRELKPVAAAASQPATESTCGCGGAKAAQQISNKDDEAMKTKAERITALEAKKIPGITKTFLETCSDAQLEALEADAAKVTTPITAATPETPVVASAAQITQPTTKDDVKAVLAEMTEEDYLSVAPKSIRDLVNRSKAAEEAERTSIVTAMQTAQTEFSEAELKAMPLDQLRKLSKVCSVNVASVDFSGRGIPRSDNGDDSTRPPKPVNLADRIKSARASNKDASATH